SQHDLAGEGLRGLDDGAYVELLGGSAEHARRGPGSIAAELRIALFELPNLALGPPARKAAMRLLEVGAAARRMAPGEMEFPGKLMGEPLVLDEALVAGRLNGLLVEAHGLAVMPFEPRDLGRYQRVLVAEGR